MEKKTEGTRRFLVDAMLGQTAKWLRLLGYDTEYVANSSDGSLLERAEGEGRILLTSDEELQEKASKKGSEAFLIKDKTEPGRIASIAARYALSLEFDPERARCPRCNGVIQEVAKAAVENRVPEKVFQKQGRFWQCTQCDKIYWAGSHLEGMGRVLEGVRGILETRRPKGA